MSISVAKIGKAVSSGLSVVCATCNRYWEARDKGIPGTQCLAKSDCGSPLKGDDFHEYKGIITDLARWCFVCGNDSRFGIRLQHRRRVIGVCEDHIKLLNELRPVDKIDMVYSRIVADIHDGNTAIPVENLVKKSNKKSLVAAILEVEGYYASKRAKD